MWPNTPLTPNEVFMRRREDTRLRLSDFSFSSPQTPHFTNIRVVEPMNTKVKVDWVKEGF